MRSILDKEMPQPRKRRPFFWWWAAAACVAGICFLYDRDNSGVQQQNGFTPESLPFVQSGTEGPAAISQKQAGSTTANAINNFKAALPGTVKGAAITTPAKIQQGTVVQQETNAASQTQFSEKGNPSVANADGLTISVAKPDESAQLSEVSEVVTNVAGAVEKTGVLSVLPPADLAIVADRAKPAMPYAAYSPIVKKAVSKNKSSKITFGFTVGANAFQVKQLPGFLGGFTADFALPGRKFGFQSGLIYRYQVFSGESRPVIPVAYDKYVHATANYDIQPEDFPNAWLYFTANNSILIPVMKSHQIEMPVMLFWQMHSRWRMYGGMTMLRHVWVESADKGLFTYDLQVVTTPDDKAAGNLNNVITGQLPAWEKNWQTGLGFKINRRIEVNLFYRSAWKGKPLLADAARLFDTCKDCSQYPEAADRTVSSLRPRSLQLNATLKF